MSNQMRAGLTEGPITQTIVKLAAPMIIGILGMILFNLADTYFVGKLGKEELAAMSFTFPIVMIVSGLAMGFGVGISSLVSRRIGKGDRQGVIRIITDSLVLTILLVAIIVFTGLFTIKPLFSLLGASDAIIPLIKQYMSIWYIGAISVVVPMIGNNAIRATGDTKTPSFVMLVSVLVNIVLDPILIFGFWIIPPMGLSGAAIATVISRTITLIVSFTILYKREGLISLKLPKFTELMQSWKNLSYIALPAAAAQIITPIGTSIFTRILATYGTETVAAYGVGTRIDMFAMSPIMALMTSLGPFVGQNLGAGRIDRIKKGLKVSGLISICWGVLTGIVLIFARNALGKLFINDMAVLSGISLYLLFVPLAYGLHGIVLMGNVTLNAMGEPLYASITNVSEIFILQIPLALLLGELFSTTGVFAAIPGAFTVSAILSMLLLVARIKRHERKPEPVPA